MEDKVEDKREKGSYMKHGHVQDELMTCGTTKAIDNNGTRT